MEQVKSGRKERIKSTQLGTLSARGMAVPTNREGVDFTSLTMYILGTCYHEKEASHDGEDG